jgi:hypothetical protein
MNLTVAQHRQLKITAAPLSSRARALFKQRVSELVGEREDVGDAELRKILSQAQREVLLVRTALSLEF